MAPHRALADLVVLGLLILVAGPAARGLPAQDGPPLELAVQEGDGSLRVRLGDVLADPEMGDALRSGLPLRISVRVELWRDGFFDSQVGDWEWRASVLYDPLDRVYLLEVGGDGSDDAVSFPTFPAIRAGLRRILDPEPRPGEPGSYYYLARIELETLSLSDLGELRRWLRGDLAEAVAGEGDVEGALERGLRRAVVRLLGVPDRRYETRTETFELEG